MLWHGPSVRASWIPSREEAWKLSSLSTGTSATKTMPSRTAARRPSAFRGFSGAGPAEGERSKRLPKKSAREAEQARQESGSQGMAGAGSASPGKRPRRRGDRAAANRSWPFGPTTSTRWRSRHLPSSAAGSSTRRSNHTRPWCGCSRPTRPGRSGCETCSFAAVSTRHAARRRSSRARRRAATSSRGRPRPCLRSKSPPPPPFSWSSFAGEFLKEHSQELLLCLAVLLIVVSSTVGAHMLLGDLLWSPVGKCALAMVATLLFAAFGAGLLQMGRRPRRPDDAGGHAHRRADPLHAGRRDEALAPTSALRHGVSGDRRGRARRAWCAG